MAKQNIYDNETSFENFKEIRSIRKCWEEQFINRILYFSDAGNKEDKVPPTVCGL